MPAKPKQPPRLGKNAKALWAEVTSLFELRADELRILEDACREVDLVDRLEAELAGADLVVQGSQGQPVANPLVQEVRQHRAVLMRLLQGLKLPEDDEAEQAAARSATMRSVANARWSRGS